MDICCMAPKSWPQHQGEPHKGECPVLWSCPGGELTLPGGDGERLSQLDFSKAMAFDQLFKNEWAWAWQEMSGRIFYRDRTVAYARRQT